MDVLIQGDKDDEIRRLLMESARGMFPGLTLTDDQAVALCMRELITFMRYLRDPRLHDGEYEQFIDNLPAALGDFATMLAHVQEAGIPEWQWRYLMARPSEVTN